LTDYGVNFEPNSEIVIVGGASAAIYFTLRTIINPGDEVLRPDPGWPQYDGAIIDTGSIPINYPLLPNKEFAIDFDKLEELVIDKTKAIIINTPNNPTGGILNEEQLKKVYEFAVNNDIFIISDEAYDKIIYEKEHIPMQKIVDDKSRIITICSASKDFAMCGWRMGFVAGAKEIMTQITKFQSLTTICPNYVSQKAYAAALNGNQKTTLEMRNEYKRRRDYFVNALNKIHGFKCYLPKGAFYAFVDISQHMEDDLAFTRNLIENVKVTCVPGSCFGPTGKGFIRFSYASSIDILEEGIKRMEEAFK